MNVEAATRQSKEATYSMATARPAIVSTPVDGKSVPDAYLRRLAISAERTMYLVKRDGKYEPLKFREVHEQVLGVWNSLRKAGIGAGDRVCVMSGSSPQWAIADLAIMSLGAVTVPIYHSSSHDDVTYILKHSGAKLVFAEDDAQCGKLKEVFAKAGLALPVVWMSQAPKVERQLRTIAFPDFAKLDESRATVEEQFRRSVESVTGDHLASIVYTSGTTGQPKGAMLRHRHFASELRTIVARLGFRSDDTTLAFLPFAHIFGRIESMAPIFAGLTLGFAESVNSVAANIQEVRPTLLVSVPRIYEKIYAKIQSDVEAGGPAKKAIFQWATATGREYARRKSEGRRIPLALHAQYQVADRLVFKKVRAKLGGRLRFAFSGGAPLARELAEFFHACGIYVLEGYGLTETTAGVTVNRLDAQRFGTVGKPLDEAEIKIASDGEILLKGAMVFDGYFENAEATAEVIKNGWFHSGDIGEIDSQGFLRITDRKKEIIVTSGGKNVAPQKIENLFKQQRLISNAMVYGDKQKYLVAVLALIEADVLAWAKQNNLAATTFAEIVKTPEMKAFLDQTLKTVNSTQASFESVKRYHIAPSDFTVETGELTPSLKLKRRVICAKFKNEIDALYS